MVVVVQKVYIFICAVTFSLGEAMLDVVVVHYLTTFNQQEVQSTGSAGMVRSAVIKPPNHLKAVVVIAR